MNKKGMSPVKGMSSWMPLFALPYASEIMYGEPGVRVMIVYCLQVLKSIKT